MLEAVRKYARRKDRGLAYRLLALALETRAWWRYFTWSRRAPARKILVLGSAGRCGSTLLTELIGSLDKVTLYGELLHDPLIFPKQFVHYHYALCETDVFGFKLLPFQCVGEPMSYLMELAGEGYQFIYVERQNLLRQAISSLHARASSEWHVRDSRKARSGVFGPQEVLNKIREIKASRDLAKGFLATVPHLEIVYERDLEPNEKHGDTIRRVADFLDIPFTPPQTTLKKRLPSSLRDIVENYDELAAALKGTEYESYLD